MTSCMDEMILLLGNACLSHSGNSDLAHFGASDQLIKRLVQLPFEYFSIYRYQNVLFPTLIILCAIEDSEVNRLIVAEDMGLEFLSLYIAKESQQNFGATPDRMSLKMRVPSQVVDYASSF